MGEEHRINEIKGVIISRALLKEYGYDGDMPTDKQMQVIGNGLLEYWGVSDGFKEALASTMENMFKAVMRTPSCRNASLARVPATTRAMVSRAEERPPPRWSRIPYFCV